MFRLKVASNNRQRKPYDRSNLVRAYEATQSGMSVYRASRMYSVPESTLRDRTRCNVSLDADPGGVTILSWDEEKQLVDHIKYMGNIGYGYTKSEIQYMATDYIKSVGKTAKSENGLSSQWFYGFMKRWPDIKLAKPQKLQMSRAKSASKEAIDKYFTELGTILQQDTFKEATERIYNIDETGISLEHTPPKIVYSSETTPQAVTSPRQSNITIIAGANAIGNSIPPFYVIPEKRWCGEFLAGALTGSAGKMSETGWSNLGIFEYYVTEHLAKHAKITENNQQPILVLYDGHRSHLSLTLTEWASKRNVMLFVLPPHTSHITQPLDVGVFGPFKNHYNRECQMYLQKNPGIAITKYEVAKLTARPYLHVKAVCPENIVSAFRKSGIYPYNPSTITPSQVAPATIYEKDDEDLPDKTTSEPTTQPITVEKPRDTEGTKEVVDKIQNFFNERKITKVVQRHSKKFVTPYSVTGSLMKKANIETLTTLQAKKNEAKEISNHPKPTPTKVKSNAKKKGCPKKQATNLKVNVKKEREDYIHEDTEMPSTSGLNKKGGPIELSTPEASDSDSEIVEDSSENCCVCARYQPQEMHLRDDIYLVTLAKCDFCPHWTHLRFCCDVRVIRRGDMFKCPHCLNKN